MDINPRELELQGVEPKIHLHLMDVEKEYGLTDCEMIKILLDYINDSKIRYFIRHERENPS